MIAFDGVSKRYGKRVVLDGLGFSLVPGAVTVLLGRNGAGKSTLLRLCLGVLKPDAGRVEVCGRDPVRHARDVRRMVGYVPDKPDVYDWMTPKDLLRFLKPQYPTWNADRAARVAEQLSVPLDTPFKALSRGEGMKAMLLAALAPDPQLLLLDEPFAGLDPVAREEVLKGVIRAGEQTILCATHDLDVAARIADRVAVLSKGKIAAHGPAEEVVGAGGQAPEKMRAILEEAVA
jgi:ABC-2 type transport system ATP-binding protein